MASRNGSFAALLAFSATLAAPAASGTEGLRGTANANNFDIRAAGPPSFALAYKGMAWPTTTIYGTDEKHVFAIGDWGGLDGSLPTPEGRPRVVTYIGGNTSGPHVFPRSRFDRSHVNELCTYSQFIECFNTMGKSCWEGCGFVVGVDTEPQILVAEQMKSRAATRRPDYILNVGDNFYWGGIERTCGTPMYQLTVEAQHQFDQIFEGIYQGPIGDQPWFSVLGNHDWGGRVFFNGWDQQIAYTWHSKRWVLPAPYWRTSIVYADLGFSVDYYFLDSNNEDAHELDMDDHNVCSKKYNVNFDYNLRNIPVTCASAGGPASVEECKDWFRALWHEQQTWLEEQLAASAADWQIVVTHFPCGFEVEWFTMLHQKLGLDLLVTGHRHDQELWSNSPLYGGLTCFVTGGGGGITSEASPADRSEWVGEAQYGFYDMTIAKEKLVLSSINYDGSIVASATVFPTPKST